MDNSLADGAGPGKHFVAAWRWSGTNPATEFQGNGFNGRLKGKAPSLAACAAMRKNGGIRMPEEVYRGRAPPPKPIAYRAVDNVRIDVEMKRRHFRRDFHSRMALLTVHRHAIIILCS